MLRIVWTTDAIKDLQRIHDYIAADSEVYANAFIEDLFYIVEHLSKFPASGRIIPETNKENIRELLVGSYRIIYEIIPSSIHVLTILHGARKLS